MPLIKLNTWPTMSIEEKKEFIYEVTELTIKRLKIVPDKIQVLITELEKEDWGKAGAVASDAIFAGKVGCPIGRQKSLTIQRIVKLMEWLSLRLIYGIHLIKKQRISG